MKESNMFDPHIWGPPFWFFLHTIAITYPLYPNAGTKKKMYEFLHTMLPSFLPVGSMSKQFQQLLSQYPVTPYLDSRDGLVRWMHFVHNQINRRLDKPEISLAQFYEHYYSMYRPPSIEKKWKMYRKALIFICIVGALMGLAFYFYR
jgi:hypothetical protein